MGFLTGKTAIITGAGRAVLKDGSCGSIGYGIATAYAKEGANLVITGRNVKKLEAAKQELESLYGIKGLPGQANYAAAKGGVIAATKALAQEVAKKGVTVNAIAPGFVRTDMTADIDEAELRKQIPAGRFCEPAEVADLAMFLISEQASYITGEVISINGGLYT